MVKPCLWVLRDCVLRVVAPEESLRAMDGRRKVTWKWGRII